MTKEQAQMIADVAMGIAEGKDIEVQTANKHWVKTNHDDIGIIASILDLDMVYRIAPEPKYIPFDYNDDLVGRVVENKELKFKDMICSQDGTRVYVIGQQILYDNLLKYHTFLDGSPCGKVKL